MLKLTTKLACKTDGTSAVIYEDYGQWFHEDGGNWYSSATGRKPWLRMGYSAALDYEASALSTSARPHTPDNPSTHACSGCQYPNEYNHPSNHPSGWRCTSCRLWAARA
jgi:hypothetical protein